MINSGNIGGGEMPTDIEEPYICIHCGGKFLSYYSLTTCANCAYKINEDAELLEVQRRMDAFLEKARESVSESMSSMGIVLTGKQVNQLIDDLLDSGLMVMK